MPRYRFGIDNGCGVKPQSILHTKGKNGDLVAHDTEHTPKPKGSLNHMAAGNKDPQDAYAPDDAS